ncbi:ABC transporter permease [Planosporangium mesophilum]|uniref:ABC transporter permease n=1 Tax=Planosporangium mesophilum TaxID=689768 RepID=A0A8J3X1I4_9ACTN|nr:sugar ABC transporter permease [Planosporangium mesophilum]NJC81389.1 sugar ABC transporter permease [Planosporangium mesophilum]GII20958.1 ABC transporter permease [Planosporangium mesophilum]
MTSALAEATPERLALRHRLAERGIDRVLLLLLPGVAFVVALFLYPFLYGLGLSFQPKQGGGPFANYQRFFAEPYLRDTIWITLRLGLPAALINVLASVPIAYRMRGPVRGKRLITTILVVPITLGTVLTAEGIIQYFGPAGWFNKVLRALHLTDGAVPLIQNYWGVLFSLIISGFPFAFLLTTSYLSGIDPSLEKAASVLGAGWWQRFRHITFPLLSPGLAMTFCLTFVLAFSVFPSAILVGDPSRTTHVISIAAVHASNEQYDYSMGSTIAMIMAVVMLIVIAIVLTWRGRMYRGATGGKG